MNKSVNTISYNYELVCIRHTFVKRSTCSSCKTAARLAALYAKAPPFDLTLSGDGVTSAVLASITATDSTAKTVTARITGVTAPDSSAEARSVLEVVYGAEAGSPSTPRPSVLTYNRNLKLGGSITVHRDAGDNTPYEISVRGDIYTDGNSITGVNNLVSTGSISIGSGSIFRLGTRQL